MTLYRAARFLRSRREPAPVTLPTSARFDTSAELEAERKRAAFWRAIEANKARLKPLDYDAEPPPV